MSPITENKIGYWRKFWKNLLDNFLVSSYGLELNSPHILIDDIILEIKENDLRNEGNKKYFHSKMCEFLKNDLIIKEHFTSNFQILRSNFNTKKHGYILQIAKELKSEFTKGIYFDRCLDLLKELLLSEKDIDSEFPESLKYYTQILIIEFIKKGYNVKDIAEFLPNIFNPYKEVNKFIMSNFPHEMSALNYPIGEKKYDADKYSLELKEYLDSLSISDRLNKLSYYYYKPKSKVRYVFVVEGLKGNKEVTIGDVTFYSVLTKKIAAEDKLEDEDLQQGLNEKFLQVAVEVDYLLNQSSLQEAISKAEIALDLFCCLYNSTIPPEINTSRYIVVDDKGVVILSSRNKSEERFLRHIESFNIDYVKDSLEQAVNSSHLTLSNPQEMNVRIINALHWYRKGNASMKQEDKILNFWIAIENLFNLESDIKSDIFDDPKKGKFNVIQEIVSCCEAHKYLYNYGWELYNYYDHLVRGQLPNKRSIPDAIIEKAQLGGSHRTIKLKNFIDSLSEIKEYENDLYYRKKIDEAIKFYSDTELAKIAVDTHMQDVKIDVLRIYRFRNLIVHNAHYDNTMLPYLSWKIKSFTGSLLRRMIFHIEKGQTLSSFFLQLYFSNEKLLLDLETGKLDLLKD